MAKKKDSLIDEAAKIKAELGVHLYIAKGAEKEASHLQPFYYVLALKLRF